MVEHKLAESRYAWVQVARGTVNLNEVELNQGDGAAIRDQAIIKVVAHDEAEVLLFDLA
jgi:hypothetical protein